MKINKLATYLAMNISGMMYSGKQIIVVMTLLMILIANNACFAITQPVIDHVDFDENADSIDIVLTFTLTVSYLSHFPASSGKQLDIRTLPIANTEDQKQAIQQPQRLAYTANESNPLQLIRYEPANPAGKVISLLFSSATNFSVPAQQEPNVITIRLQKKAAARAPEADVQTPVTLEDSDNFKYLINLMSSQQVIKPVSHTDYPYLKPYLIYTTRHSVDSIEWNRIRLGFFRSKDEAQAQLKQVLKDFPRAWIDRVKDDERENIQPWLFSLARNNNQMALAQNIPEKPREPVRITKESQQLFADAKKNIIDGEYRKAVLILTKLLNLPENESSEAAQELIGVAREKNRQIAHAIAEYKKYLKKYPKGEFHNRVTQRLDGLTSARKTSSKTLRKAKASTGETPWQTYGTLFQFYRRYDDTTELRDAPANSSLDTDLSLSARKRTKALDIRTQFTGSYQYNLEKANENDYRISSLYIDIADRKRNWNARMGIQTQSTGGVLGRFDGLSVGYRLSPKWKLNAVAGFPVYSSSADQFQIDKVFYGMSLDAGTFNKYWNASTFIIKQTAEDLDDRTAVGAEIRYLHPETTVFGLIDYDIDYNSLNIAQLIANTRLPFDTSINLVADYRNGPILTTSNALQGQTSTTLEELLLTYTEDEIKQLAKDRTTVFRSVSGTLSKSLTSTLVLSLDLAASHLESSPASGGVDATPSTGLEYFYGAQLIANNIFKDGDTSLFGIRYADTSASDTLTLAINSRYPYKKDWRFNPRIRIDSQTRIDNSKILRFRPSLRVDYRAVRKVKVELELGYEQSNIDDAFGSRTQSNYFINMGYIADF